MYFPLINYNTGASGTTTFIVYINVVVPDVPVF